jgi:transposase-like protein
MKKGARLPTSRRVFSNKEKVDWVAQWKAGTLYAKAFERSHGLPECSIRKWREQLSELRAADPAGFSKQGSAHSQLELRVMEWLRLRWSWRGFRVSPHMIQARARQVAAQKHLEDFVGSAGWYEKFKYRSGLRTVRLHGERASADHQAALDYGPKFRQLVAELGLSTSSVYNADETLLYPRLQLRTTVCLEKYASELRGKKEDKFRVGMMVTSCADGSHGCPLLFAHSSGKPRTMDAKEYPQLQQNVRIS